MKKLGLAVILLIVLAALADALVVARVHADPWRVGAVLVALALLLGAFVVLTDGRCLRALRHWAERSWRIALALPLLLLIPYLIYALGTGTFGWRPLGKLAAFVLAPTAALLPDRLRHRQRATWRDFVAMAAMAVPLPAHWLSDTFVWPEELYFFLPLIAVCAGIYGFAVVRNLEDVGYSLLWRLRDITTGVASFILFSILAIPLGYALHFIRFHPHRVAWGALGAQFAGIYLTIAIPEEVLFRGILQNLLVKTIRRGPSGRYGLLIAAVIFGASHFHHPPVPNWRYCIMATLAGIFYGIAYQTRRRTASSALTHALVDTLWHFWF